LAEGSGTGEAVLACHIREKHGRSWPCQHLKITSFLLEKRKGDKENQYLRPFGPPEEQPAEYKNNKNIKRRQTTP